MLRKLSLQWDCPFPPTQPSTPEAVRASRKGKWSYFYGNGIPLPTEGGRPSLSGFCLSSSLEELFKAQEELLLINFFLSFCKIHTHRRTHTDPNSVFRTPGLQGKKHKSSRYYNLGLAWRGFMRRNTEARVRSSSQLLRPRKDLQVGFGRWGADPQVPAARACSRVSTLAHLHHSYHLPSPSRVQRPVRFSSLFLGLFLPF